MRITNLLLYIFLGLTLFLLIIHVRRSVYFENQSKNLTEKVYSGSAKISIHLTSSEDKYRLSCSFHHIKAAMFVKNLDIQMLQFGKSQSETLNLEKVLPYSGMHNWDIPEFKSFVKIPDSLKALNSSSNPYFAFDFFFKSNLKNPGDKFAVTIAGDFIENGQHRQLNKELSIIRKSKLEIKPLYAHSDATFLLIPVAGLITVILLFTKVVVLLMRKRLARKSIESDRKCT